MHVHEMSDRLSSFAQDDKSSSLRALKPGLRCERDMMIHNHNHNNSDAHHIGISQILSLRSERKNRLPLKIDSTGRQASSRTTYVVQNERLELLTVRHGCLCTTRSFMMQLSFFSWYIAAVTARDSLEYNRCI
jgi:hypothetical protein